MKTLTFEQAANEFDTIAKRTGKAFNWALAEAQEDLFTRVLQNSSGTASLALLRKADHPYARRHGSPRLAPGIINEQSGVFLSNWRREPIVPNGDGIIANIFNADPKAGYLEQRTPPPSKTKMFARPVDDLSLSETVPNIERDFDLHFDQIWRF